MDARAFDRVYGFDGTCKVHFAGGPKTLAFNGTAGAERQFLDDRLAVGGAVRQAFGRKQHLGLVIIGLRDGNRTSGGIKLIGDSGSVERLGNRCLVGVAEVSVERACRRRAQHQPGKDSDGRKRERADRRQALRHRRLPREAADAFKNGFETPVAWRRTRRCRDGRTCHRHHAV